MDQPMSGFPLAVAGDRGDTVWHRVIVQGEHVEQVQAGFSTGSIKKGRPVEVTGQHVTRQEPTARGTRSVKEFHATSVTRQRPTSTRPPQQR
jgi:single-stranded DNA-binding protein